MHTSGPVAGLIAGTLLAAGGYVTAFSLGKPIRDAAAASVSWPTTAGRITRSEVTRSKNDGKAMYSVDIAYAYSTAGRSFTGERVWFGDDASSSDATPFRRAVSRYPVGRVVQVHYDPADAAESVLEPGVTWAASFVYLLGLGLLVLGALLVLSAIGPLGFVLAALLGGVGRRDRDADEVGRPLRQAGHGTGATASSGADDGITIG